MIDLLINCLIGFFVGFTATFWLDVLRDRSETLWVKVLLSLLYLMVAGYFVFRLYYGAAS